MNNIYKFVTGFFTLSIIYGLSSHFFLDNQKGARVLFEEKANLVKKDELAKKYVENLFDKIDNNKEKKEELEIGINYLKSKLQAHENSILAEKKMDNNLINEATKPNDTIKSSITGDEISKNTSNEIVDNKIVAKNPVKEKIKVAKKPEEVVVINKLNNKDVVSKVQSKITMSKTKEPIKSEKLIAKDPNTKIVSSKTSSPGSYSKFYEIDSTKNIYKSDNQKFAEKYQQIQVVRLERVKKLNEDF
jgi:hypothetical protein